MCTITATEFKKNFGKYLKLIKTEDILITKNSRPIATLSKTKSDDWDDLVEKWSKYDEYELDEEDPRIAHMLSKL